MAVVTTVTLGHAKLQSDHHHQHTDNWFGFLIGGMSLPAQSTCPKALKVKTTTFDFCLIGLFFH